MLNFVVGRGVLLANSPSWFSRPLFRRDKQQTKTLDAESYNLKEVQKRSLSIRRRQMSSLKAATVVGYLECREKSPDNIWYTGRFCWSRIKTRQKVVGVVVFGEIREYFDGNRILVDVISINEQFHLALSSCGEIYVHPERAAVYGGVVGGTAVLSRCVILVYHRETRMSSVYDRFWKIFLFIFFLWERQGYPDAAVCLVMSAAG